MQVVTISEQDFIWQFLKQLEDYVKDEDSALKIHNIGITDQLMNIFLIYECI